MNISVPLLPQNLMSYTPMMYTDYVINGLVANLMSSMMSEHPGFNQILFALVVITVIPSIKQVLGGLGGYTKQALSNVLPTCRWLAGACQSGMAALRERWRRVPVVVTTEDQPSDDTEVQVALSMNTEIAGCFRKFMLAECDIKVGDRCDIAYQTMSEHKQGYTVEQCCFQVGDQISASLRGPIKISYRNQDLVIKASAEDEETDFVMSSLMHKSVRGAVDLWRSAIDSAAAKKLYDQLSTAEGALGPAGGGLFLPYVFYHLHLTATTKKLPLSQANLETLLALSQLITSQKWTLRVHYTAAKTMYGVLATGKKIFRIRGLTPCSKTTWATEFSPIFEQYDSYFKQPVKVPAPVVDRSDSDGYMFAAAAASAAANLLVFNVRSPTVNSRLELTKAFNDFFQKDVINKYRVRETNVVNIYEISVDRTETKQSQPNPAFSEWLQHYRALRQDRSPRSERGAAKSTEDPASRSSVSGGDSDKKSPDPPSPKSDSDFSVSSDDSGDRSEIIRLLGPQPPRTVETVDVQTSIRQQLVNKCYKDLNTLYLKKQDHQRITSVLQHFHHNRELYQTLGLPYKLGVLLHGPPGTGKSTTIKAIASYLGRDIFYVNLQNVRNNSDLKMIFDHINGNCGSGLIIFEDIDVMSTVVHRRAGAEDLGAASPGTLSDAVNSADDTLTLSYLLNILDGTLCKENTIFVITTNHLEVLDPALYRRGRIDIQLKLDYCDHHQVSKIFKMLMKRDLAQEVLAQIPSGTFTPADVIFEVFQFISSDEPDEVVMARFLGTGQ